MAVPVPIIPVPWQGLVLGTVTPRLRQPQIGRITSTLLHLADAHDYPPFSYLPDTLNAYSSRGTRINNGIWAYFHEIPILPRVDEIRDLALPPPVLVLPQALAGDLGVPWVPLAAAPVRNTIFNPGAPHYRLLFFLHRFPSDVDAPYNSPQEVFGFTVWDREISTLRYYDFWDQNTIQRQQAVWAYWARVVITFRNVPAPGPVLPNLYAMLANGYNNAGGNFASMHTLAAQAGKTMPARISIHAVLGAALYMLNRIDNAGVLTPRDSSRTLSGLDRDLIPRMFDRLIAMLRAQPVIINFTAPLPRARHLLPHAGQPFNDQAWVRVAFHITNDPLNFILRDRLRGFLAARVAAGTMPAWYVTEMFRLLP